MLEKQTSTHTDPHHGLSVDLFRVAIFKLRNEVPPAATSDPVVIEQFVNAGIAEIASMVPANADEVSMAVRVLSAEAQASDCIRHARMHFNDSAGAMKCHALANHYQRSANAARALLLRVQAARQKREAAPATCSSDAWTVNATAGLLVSAAAGDAVPPPPPPREPAPPPSAPAPPPTRNPPAATEPSATSPSPRDAPPASAAAAAFPPPSAAPLPSRTVSRASSSAPAPSSA